MADIQFEIPTSRPPAELRDAVERKLRDRLGDGKADLRWEGETLRLRGRSAEGSIELLPGRIRVQAHLSGALAFFPLKVEREIKSALAEIAEP